MTTRRHKLSHSPADSRPAIAMEPVGQRSYGGEPVARGPRCLPFVLAPLSLAIVALHSVVPAHAQELGAHEHGAAQLDVLIDGDMLLIDLDTPAANVLGFEHAPSTDEQRDAVASARALLESGELFVPDAAAGCTLDSAEVEIALADEDAEHSDEHHDDEHEEGHDEEHGDEHAEDHDDEHADDHGDEHADHEDAVHSDITAAYAYRCDEPAALDQVTTTLFGAFDGGFEDIDVQLAGPGGQSAAELSPQQTTIELEAIR